MFLFSAALPFLILPKKTPLLILRFEVWPMTYFDRSIGRLQFGERFGLGIGGARVPESVFLPVRLRLSKVVQNAD